MALAHLNTGILNHLLNQQPWSKDQLCRYAGKTICIVVPPATLHLLIESNGEFAALTAEEGTEPDATLSLHATAAIKFVLQKQLDTSQLSMEGDTELATEIGKILRTLSWDIEEDLSRIIGDIPAHQVVSTGKLAFREAKRQIFSLSGMFAEFWQEEDPMIAKKRHLDQFAQDVDTLRDDIERLAKRIEKLDTSV